MAIAMSRAAPAAPRRAAWLLHPMAKPAVFVACLLPLAWLVLAAASNRLGANPAEALIRSTGDWTLRMLCITLAVTPLREWTGQAALARFRRMLGLFVFFYALLHFNAYAWLDMGFELSDIARDIAKRPFILVGMLCLLLLVPLAATSVNAAVKALGAARWRALHRSVYAIVLLALLHFFWMRSGKNDFGEVAIYAAIVGVLLAWRLRGPLRRLFARLQRQQ
jgi:sulfoxide reductase heme-binding subunit YedZ